MPQHERSSPIWIARRLGRGLSREWELRRRPPTTPLRPGAVNEDPQVTQVPRTTVDATIRFAAGARSGAGSQLGSGGDAYRLLGWGPGEPHLVREDLGVRARPGRIAARTSVLYFAQHTDAHICDAQSPGRLEAGERLAWLAAGTDAGHRPQEHSTVQVLDQMVRATNAVSISPDTGAPMAFCVQTGDNTDNRELCELRWFIDTLDGAAVTPNTGSDRYEGVQADRSLSWVYHPEDPSRDPYGRFGFPRLPGLLSSVLRTVDTVGLEMPWLAVMGNHDAVFQGTFGRLGPVRLDELEVRLAAGGRKPVSLLGYVWDTARVSLGGSDGARDGDVAVTRAPAGWRTVTADRANRMPVDTRRYVEEFFRTSPDPGPIGHGFTRANVAAGTAYWSRTVGDRVLLVGLDTNNHTAGSEGRLGPVQFGWLRGVLDDHPERHVVVFSHHNSTTITNGTDDASDPGEAFDGARLVELLAAHPGVVAWVNGHNHENRIRAHRGSGVETGFWELTTASCVDFGQQCRTVELLDNGDGTLSLLSTVLDHAAPPLIHPPADGHFTPVQLASLSREFAANDARWYDPFDQLGRPEDRNVELLIGCGAVRPGAA